MRDPGLPERPPSAYFAQAVIRLSWAGEALSPWIVVVLNASMNPKSADRTLRTCCRAWAVESQKATTARTEPPICGGAPAGPTSSSPVCPGPRFSEALGAISLAGTLVTANPEPVRQLRTLEDDALPPPQAATTTDNTAAPTPILNVIG